MPRSDELEQIIEGCRAGREESFAKLVDLYAARCYGYFYRLTGSRTLSDDLLAELFLKLVTKIRSYRGGGFDGWLFKTASNVFHDYLRQKQRRKKALEAERIRKSETKLTVSGHEQDLADRLQLRLEQLDGDTRELIMLRFYSKLSFKELAKIRGEPIGTTLSKVHRGLKKLRELMEQ